jgi:hypothetical protein
MHCWKSCETLAIVSSERSSVLYTKQEGEMYLHWKAKKYDFQAAIFSAGPQRLSLVQDDHLASRAIFARWPVMCNAKDAAAKRSVLLLCRETRQAVHRTCRECESVVVGVCLCACGMQVCTACCCTRCTTISFMYAAAEMIREHFQG